MPDQDSKPASSPSSSTIRTPADAPAAINAVDFVRDALAQIKDDGSIDLSVEAMVTLNILQLVASPELVKVHIARAVKFVILEFDVVDSDKGKVIGRDGHTIDALRSLAKSLSGGSGVEYDIQLIEDRVHHQERYHTNRASRRPRDPRGPRSR